MFEETLLDSSPRRVAVLSRTHYLISFLAGALIFALSLRFLPMVLAPATGRALFIASGLIACAAALESLMLAYVWADARQNHLRAGAWFAVALLLNLPGFLIYLVRSALKTGDWKRAAIPLAYVAEAMLVSVSVLVPLIYTQALPTEWLKSEIHIPPPPSGTAPKHGAAQPAPQPKHPTVNPFVAPPVIPPIVATIADQPEPPQIDSGPPGPYIPGLTPGSGSGYGNLPFGAPWDTATPPPPPVVHPAAKKQLYRQGGDVTAARAIYQPRPEYPALARMARVQGTVVLQAIIGQDGAIQDLKVLSGHPLLVKAAIDAVKTWRYQPTLLNSEPVDVLTEIDVTFTLGE